MPSLPTWLNHSPAAWSALFAALAFVATVTFGLLQALRTRRAPDFELRRTDREREGVFFYALTNFGNGAAFDVRIEFLTIAGGWVPTKAPRGGRITSRGSHLLVPRLVGPDAVRRVRVLYKVRPKSGRDEVYETDVV